MIKYTTYTLVSNWYPTQTYELKISCFMKWSAHSHLQQLCVAAIGEMTLVAWTMGHDRQERMKMAYDKKMGWTL